MKLFRKRLAKIINTDLDLIENISSVVFTVKFEESGEQQNIIIDLDIYDHDKKSFIPYNFGHELLKEFFNILEIENFSKSVNKLVWIYGQNTFGFRPFGIKKVTFNNQKKPIFIFNNENDLVLDENDLVLDEDYYTLNSINDDEK